MFPSYSTAMDFAAQKFSLNLASPGADIKISSCWIYLDWDLESWTSSYIQRRYMLYTYNRQVMFLTLNVGLLLPLVIMIGAQTYFFGPVVQWCVQVRHGYTTTPCDLKDESGQKHSGCPGLITDIEDTKTSKQQLSFLQDHCVQFLQPSLPRKNVTFSQVTDMHANSWRPIWLCPLTADFLNNLRKNIHISSSTRPIVLTLVSEDS